MLDENIQQAKKSLIKGIHLGSTKKNALIDFLFVLPEIATAANSKDNIKHGFI